MPINLDAVNETIWVTELDIAELFETTRQNVNLHIQNILKDGELLLNSVRKDSLHTAPDGKKYSVAFYNLDMVLAVGFRTRTSMAISFRKWVNEILKKVITKGYVVDKQTCLECKNSILELKTKVYELEERQNHSITYFPGDQDKAFIDVVELLKTAKKEIIIIDNYIGHTFDEVLKQSGVEVTIITNIKNKKIDSNKIYKVIKLNLDHDRFVIVDDTCYHFGPSLESLGDKLAIVNRITDKPLINLLKTLKSILSN